MSAICRGNDNPPDQKDHGWAVMLVLPLVWLFMWLVTR